MGTKIWPVALIILLLLAFVGFWFVMATRVASAIKANRTEIVYDIKYSSPSSMSSSVKEGIQTEAIRVITHRLRSLSSVGTNVKPVGESAVSVEFPKRLRLVEVKTLLEAEGRIQLFWAKNLTTDKTRSRRFDVEQSRGDKNSLDLMFIDQFDTTHKPFDRTDPRYQTMLNGWVPVLESEDVLESSPKELGSSLVPGISFTPSGAKKLQAWCRKYHMERENLAFVVDGKVISIAPLQEGTILSDSAIITGKFDKDYVRKLCSMIGAGRLPVKLVERTKPAK